MKGIGFVMAAIGISNPGEGWCSDVYREQRILFYFALKNFELYYTT